MQKRLLLIFLLVLVPSVYSLSLFPKDNNILSLNIIELKEVHYDKKNTLELVLESNSNLKIDGIIVNINNNDNIIVNNQLNSFETKIYTINTKEALNTIQIRFFNDINHKRNIINQVITYRITGNEENIIQQQEQILIQDNQQLQQEFNNNPSYISYSSYSKLDDNKNIIYFTKDTIGSNRITTNNQGNIEYQANYQPYGSIFTETGQEKYKFSGKELDSSNLYYFGARYYNSNIGRFTQVDPIFKYHESPYQYANNNPIRYVDLDGKEAQSREYRGNADEVSKVLNTLNNKDKLNLFVIQSTDRNADPSKLLESEIYTRDYWARFFPPSWLMGTKKVYEGFEASKIDTLRSERVSNVAKFFSVLNSDTTTTYDALIVSSHGGRNMMDFAIWDFFELRQIIGHKEELSVDLNLDTLKHFDVNTRFSPGAFCVLISCSTLTVSPTDSSYSMPQELSNKLGIPVIASDQITANYNAWNLRRIVGSFEVVYPTLKK